MGYRGLGHRQWSMASRMVEMPSFRAEHQPAIALPTFRVLQNSPDRAIFQENEQFYLIYSGKVSLSL
jgi:hypothetical protein